MGKHEQASLLKSKRKNLRAYSMPCHGILLVYSFATWILLTDVVEYFTMSHPWFFLDEQLFIDFKHGFVQESCQK